MKNIIYRAKLLLLLFVLCFCCLLCFAAIMAMVVLLVAFVVDVVMMDIAATLTCLFYAGGALSVALISGIGIVCCVNIADKEV